jgi:hypothetical protein
MHYVHRYVDKDNKSVSNVSGFYVGMYPLGTWISMH